MAANAQPIFTLVPRFSWHRYPPETPTAMVRGTVVTSNRRSRWHKNHRINVKAAVAPRRMVRLYTMMARPACGVECVNPRVRVIE